MGALTVIVSTIKTIGKRGVSLTLDGAEHSVGNLKRDYLLEERSVSGGKMLILVHAAEEPVLIGDLTPHLVKEGGHGVEVAGVIAEQILDLGGTFVSDNEVDIEIVAEKIVDSLGHLFCGGSFLGPPLGAALLAKLDVGTAAAAHGKDSLALELIDLTAAEMVKIGLDAANTTAVPFGFGIFVKAVKVLMTPIYKKDGVLLTSEKCESFFLTATAVPDKAEVAADDKVVIFSKTGKAFVLKT